MEKIIKQFEDHLVFKSPKPRVRKLRKIRTFDIDGVIFINAEIGGLRPDRDDVIITGRSLFDEEVETFAMLKKRGIKNRLYMNPVPFEQKSRLSSGTHKANIISKLQSEGFLVTCHFEDDEIQAAEIRKHHPNLPVVMVVHDLTNKENVRHLNY